MRDLGRTLTLVSTFGTIVVIVHGLFNILNTQKYPVLSGDFKQPPDMHVVVLDILIS